MINIKIPADAPQKYQERLNRVKTAISFGQPDRVPAFLSFDSWTIRVNGGCYKDLYYNHEEAADKVLRFYSEHPLCDVSSMPTFVSGRANEIAGTQMIDWPGRPGTKVSDFSSHQVIEKEFMSQEEYPEMLKDFTGFMLRKYIPRAYPALKGFSQMQVIPTCVLDTNSLASLYSPEALEAYRILAEIGELSGRADAVTGETAAKLSEMGFPEMMTGFSEAPYDILGDYFRGTMGIFEDLVDEDMWEYIDAACDLFADQQIEALQYFRYVDMPVKIVMFPLHKAMDGFMSDRQFERFYWKPLKKIMTELFDMDVVPYIYTEGPFRTRLDFLKDVPRGKVLYHFENVDMKLAKKELGGIACICGNLPIAELEFGSKQNVVEKTRQLLEDCMPGGGYMFDFNAALDNAKPENIEVVFETLEKYGKY